MDVRIEAASMAAGAEMPAVVIIAQKVKTPQVILVLSNQVASFSCPSIAGSSLSAVSPDYDFIGGTALAAA